MKVYVASSFLNKVDARFFMTMLERAGHVVTYDWTQHPPTDDLEELERESVQDVKGVADADVFILLWPGRLGSSTELGVAIALKKEIILVGDVPRVDSVFFNHPACHYVPTMTDAVDRLFWIAKDLNQERGLECSFCKLSVS